MSADKGKLLSEQHQKVQESTSQPSSKFHLDMLKFSISTSAEKFIFWEVLHSEMASLYEILL